MIEIKFFSEFRQVETVWHSLWQSDSTGTIYQSPEYASLILRHFMPYRILLRAKPIFAVWYRDGLPILLLPLLKRDLGAGYDLFGYRCGGGYLDGIYPDSLDVCTMKECFDLLHKTMSGQTIRFRRVREDTRLGQFLLQSGASRCETACTAIDLPECYEDYYQSLSKHMRQNLRTAYNRLTRDERKLTCSVVPAKEMTDANRKALLQIYIQRQSTQYRRMPKAVFSAYVNRVDMATHLMREFPQVMTFVLEIDGTPAAYMDAVQDGEILRIPRLAIDESFGTYSPGVLLLNESIQRLISKGEIHTLDLTHGEEGYKRAMGGYLAYCIDWDMTL